MENHAVGAIKTLPFCVGRAERSQKMPVIGSAMGRKMLSDITNTARAVEVAGDGESDAVDNPALLKLLYEKSKIIEMSGMELLNLRTALQKAHQQNWQLAQANSRMLGELNQGKDRLKVMQHELSCALALVRAKTLEVEEQKKIAEIVCEMVITEEQKKVAKHVPEKTITELKKEGDANVEVVAERNNPASSKNVCGTNRKRALRTKSLGSSNAAHEVTSVKEKDEKRRRSLRRKSQVCEPTEDLFEIEDAKFLICSSSEPLHETGSSPVEISVKEFENEQNDSPQNQNQNSRRSLSGRPVRKATEKVCSYKERPINVKMRRGE
ncbi:shugoshin-1-like isoform X1 [Dioscorea cayenensis subsp. rotundata]|uniref:Shugoshin-1-like isoform X1 n=1 Tax=Dioscorea cayennensis subsp. rotundata TaxID=55577 RepID=A0AB40CII4_DIOCR|nr:shugoshin-1-like isoform X1 [Dioscorea cayenensis subsp. rotundata]